MTWLRHTSYFKNFHIREFYFESVWIKIIPNSIKILTYSFIPRLPSKRLASGHNLKDIGRWYPHVPPVNLCCILNATAMIQHVTTLVSMLLLLWHSLYSYPTRLWKMKNFDIFTKLFLKIIVKSFLIKYDNYID